MVYITKKMVEDGLMSKAITITYELDNTPRVHIGKHGFWVNPDHLDMKLIRPGQLPFWYLADRIHYILDSIYQVHDFYEEYEYYYKWLCDNI